MADYTLLLINGATESLPVGAKSCAIDDLTLAWNGADLTWDCANVHQYKVLSRIPDGALVFHPIRVNPASAVVAVLPGETVASTEGLTPAGAGAHIQGDIEALTEGLISVVV